MGLHRIGVCRKRPPLSGRRGEYLTDMAAAIRLDLHASGHQQPNPAAETQLTDRYDQPPTQTHAIQATGPDTESGPLRQVAPSLRRQSQTTPHSNQQRANRDQSALTGRVAECQWLTFAGGASQTPRNRLDVPFPRPATLYPNPRNQNTALARPVLDH
jgi:hypothetical protein